VWHARRNLETRAGGKGLDMPRGGAAGFARVTLATIRIVNGGTALFAPSFLARKLGVEPDDNQAIRYVLRMFGVRTILIGIELVLPDGEVRTAAVRVAPVIHATDTVSAAIAGLTRQVPARPALTATAISALNTALALTARAGEAAEGAHA
jgi:hypothetical protein